MYMVLLLKTHTWLRYSHVWLEHPNGYGTVMYGATGLNTQSAMVQSFMVLLVEHTHGYGSSGSVPAPVPQGVRGVTTTMVWPPGGIVRSKCIFVKFSKDDPMW